MFSHHFLLFPCKRKPKKLEANTIYNNIALNLASFYLARESSVATQSITLAVFQIAKSLQLNFDYAPTRASRQLLLNMVCVCACSYRSQVCLTKLLSHFS